MFDKHSRRVFVSFVVFSLILGTGFATGGMSYQTAHAQDATTVDTATDTGTATTDTTVTEPASDTPSTDVTTTDTSVSGDTTTADQTTPDGVVSFDVVETGTGTTDTAVVTDATATTDAVVTTDTVVTDPTPTEPIPAPVLTTDKADYQPGSTATIFGNFFQALQNIVLKIFGGSTIDGTYTETIANVATDALGSFTHFYTLDNVMRPLYTVIANSVSGEQLAQTTFTDNVGYDKSGYDKGSASWGTGNQAGYSENDWVQYQYTITGITAAVPNFNITYDEQVSGRMFIDGFSNFRYIVDAPYAAANSVLANGVPRPPATDTGGWHSFLPLNINNTHSGGNCNTTDPLNTPSAEHCFRVDPSNATFQTNNPSFPVSFSSGTHSITIFYEAHMAATFVWSTGHESSLGNDLTIYGVHAPTAAVPSGVSFGTGIYSTWTTTAFNGAAGGGSSKHFNIDDQSAGSSGKISLPIPAVTLPTGSITITKVTSPTPAVGITFPFTSDFGPFTLDTDPSVTNSNSITFSSLPAATFNFTETQPVVSGWALTNLSCVTTSGTAGSTFSTSIVTGLSTINLASGAVVTCTYTNSINQVTPTVTTAIHDGSHGVVTSVAAGTTVHDSVSVTGTNGTATGNVTFDWFTNGTCTPAPSATSGAIALSSGAADAIGFPQGPLNAGSYSFKAHYPGDSHYFAADSACEPLTINKIDSTTVTEIHNASEAVVTSVAAGTTVHDKATVSGAFGTPTGNVDFTWYTSNNCTTGGSASGTGISLSGGVAHPSTSQGPLNAGSYSFKAHYNGDTNYNASDGACEPLTVNKVNSTTVTEIHNASEAVVTSVVAGTTVHDKATVSGSVGTPTGNVDFTWYTSNDCTTGGSTSGTGIALVSGVAHPSTSQGPLNAGLYSFKAHYNGDTNYNASDASCEPLTVTQLTPTVVTEIHNDSIHTATTTSALGSTVHDKATVTGSLGTPSGTATFSWFTNGTCANTPSDTSSAQTLASGSVDATGFAKGPLGAGSYSFKAHYNGDTNYVAADGPCEPLTVSKNDLSLVTEIHNASEAVVTSVDAGTTVHDKATASGISGSFAPANNVTFTFYPNNTCTDQGAAAGSVALAGTVAHPSTSQGPLNAGSYSFQATIASDPNYNGATSPCEPLTVNKINSNTATVIHDANHGIVTSVDAGATVHDQATITGGFGTPTGNVDFTWYTNNACEGQGSASGTAIALVAGIAHPSTSQGPLNAGSYSFKAHYNGDTNYNASDATCEPLTVNQLTPTVVTEIHKANEDVVVAALDLGTTVHDKATVTGTGPAVTGTVDFTFYPNNTCERGTAAGTGIAIASGIAHPSSSEGPLAAGSYSFKAHYNGDVNYFAGDSDCEPLTVNKANTTTDTKVHDTDHEDITNTAVALGSIVHDSATVGTQVDSIAITGNVTYHFYAGAQCSGIPTDETVAVGVESADTSPLAAGSYGYIADYSGDSNYNASTGTCEPFTVDKAQLTVDTIIHDADHNATTTVALSSVVHDTATVSGGVTGFTVPTPSFTFTTNYTNTCDQGTPVADNGVDGSAIKSVDSAALAAGTYAYRGSVAGNDNYLGDDSPCEPLTVNKATPTPTTDTRIDNESVRTIETGSSVYDTVTIAGNGVVTPSGTVTFDFFTNGTCTQPSEATSGAFPLDENGFADASAFAQGPLAAGLYSFLAHYSGDGNYDPANAGCELVTVVDGSIALSPLQADNAINHAHTITALVTQNNGTATSTVASALVTFSITSGSATFVAGNTCTTNGSGLCSIQINSLTTGANTIDATTTFSVLGVSLTRATNGNYGPDGTGPASKNYDNARISITPDAATNEVGNAHDFTVTVEQDTGSGFVPVPAGTLANAVATPAPDGGLNVSDCTAGVNASGQCTVTINSSVAGIFTIIARSTVVVNGVTFKLQTNGTGGNSAPAVKTYVDAKIALTPGQATNNVNDPHTITATVTEDPGTGPVAASGELVTFTLVNNTAGAAFVGSIDTCTTNGSGQCNVQINTATPGTVEIHGTVDVGVSTLTLHRESDSTHGSSGNADKTYVAGKITVIKQTLPDGSQQSFDFTPSYETAFSLTDGNSNTSDWLAPGTSYNVSEIVPTGWDQTSATCDHGTPAAIEVLAGQTTTCTFTNTQRGHIIVDKVTDPSGDPQSFSFDATGGVYADFGLTDAATPNDQELIPGTYGVSEGALANWTQTSATCDDQSPVNAISLQPGETVHCTFNNTKKGNITIVKDAQPNDLQDFAFAGTLGGFSLDNDQGVSGEDNTLLDLKTFTNKLPGNYTVTETLPNSFWTFGGVTCVNTIGGAPYTNVTNVTNGVTIALNPGADVTCTYVNIKQSPTRTLGFWQTHTAYTSGVFAAAPISNNMPIGTTPHKGFITTVGQLFGAFYASIPKMTIGGNRQATDKARMQLLQQLVAAKLNCANFGCAASVTTMIATADAAYAGTSASAILASASLLDAFNNSGDTITIGPAGSATPSLSKSLADLVFWNTP